MNSSKTIYQFTNFANLQAQDQNFGMPFWDCEVRKLLQWRHGQAPWEPRGRRQPSSSTSTKEPFTQAQEHWTAFLEL